MGLFGKKSAFLGIDFGASSLKIVELAFKNQRPELTNYAYASIPEGVGFGDALRTVVEQMKPRTRMSYVALPGSSGLVTLISFPKMSHNELAQAVLFEARKYIPIPLDEVNISWDVVAHSGGKQEAKNKQEPSDTEDKAGNKSDGNKESKEKQGRDGVQKKESDGEEKMYVLLVAAPRKTVAEYEEYVMNASLKMNALELETFSLTRALVGDDIGRFLIADIGAQTTNIVLVDRGIIRANRNVAIGGENITRKIVETVGLNKERAEKYKRDQGDLLINDGIASRVVGMIIDEMRHVGTVGGDTMADNVIITGGASKLNGMREYIEKALGVTVTYGNPWARVAISEEVMPYVQPLCGEFAVAVGLALRGIEEYRHA